MSNDLIKNLTKSA